MRRFVVVVSSLCAEGTPVLALELFRHWQAGGLSPELLVLSPERADLAPEFEALGVKPSFARLGAGRGRFVRMASEAARFTRERGAQALLSFPLGWHAFLAYGARWAGAKRAIAHVGNYPPHWTGAAFDKFRFQVQAGRAVTDALVCCSDYVRDGVISFFGVPPEEAVTVYNGVPVEDVAARAEEARRGAASHPFRVGMVARLEVHKDQPTLIRAAAELSRRGRPLEVWLVGDGSRRAEYEALIRGLGVASSVKLLGTRRDIPELLGQLDAFVFSAKRDEGFGIALVEAMAAGVPVIATDVGACREVLKNGELGALVPAGSVEALSRAMAALASDPDAARQRAAAAKRRAAQFTIAAMAERYAELLA